MSSSTSVVVVLVAAISMVAGDSCTILGDYIANLEQINPSNLTTEAAENHPAESTAEAGLTTCSSEDSCCSSSSEELLREASGEVFDVYAITMAIQTIEDDVKLLRWRAKDQIRSAVTAADGAATAELLLEYLAEELETVEEVSTAKLAQFFAEVYGADYGDDAETCLSGLTKSRAAMTERVSLLASLYKDLLKGLEDGEKLLSVIMTEMTEAGKSESCSDALVRSSLFAGLGCKRCMDATARVPTCYHTCINVVRGCMRGLLCHTDRWQTWAAEMEEFVSRISEMSEGRWSFYMSLGETVAEELTEVGEAGTWNSDCFIGDKDDEKMAQLGQKSLLLSVIESGVFSPKLGDQLAVVPESICSETNYISDVQYEVDTDCWNGQEISSYLQPTPPFTLEFQKCNPEVSPSALSCDARTVLSCSAYDVFTSPGPATGAVKNPDDGDGNSSASGLSSVLLLLVVTLVKLLL